MQTYLFTIFRPTEETDQISQARIISVKQELSGQIRTGEETQGLLADRVLQDCDLTFLDEYILIEGIYLLPQHINLRVKEHVFLTEILHLLPHSVPLL